MIKKQPQRVEINTLTGGVYFLLAAVSKFWFRVAKQFNIFSKRFVDQIN